MLPLTQDYEVACAANAAACELLQKAGREAVALLGVPANPFVPGSSMQIVSGETRSQPGQLAI
jgi:hypothetical protein